jgi:hypothetical protein
MGAVEVGQCRPNERKWRAIHDNRVLGTTACAGPRIMETRSFPVCSCTFLSSLEFAAASIEDAGRCDRRQSTTRAM